MSSVGIVTPEAPYVLPSAAAPTAVSVDSVSIADASITTRGKTLATIETNAAALACAGEINSTYHIFDLISNVAGVKTWTGYLRGTKIGECTNEKLTVYACSATEADTDDSETLSVTVAPGTWGPLIQGVLEAVQDLLQNAGAGYPYLNAVASEDITIGERLLDYDFPLIHIEPATDNLGDYTSGNKFLSEFTAKLCIETKDPDSIVALEELTQITGDVIDLLQDPDNRQLSGLIRLQTPTVADWAYIEEARDRKKKSSMLRWLYLDIDVEMIYRGG